MPQPPTAARFTAGEQRLANLIDSPAASKSSRNAETTAAARPHVDLIWAVEPDGQGDGLG